ncbi:hypothetical protein [Micromonospora sagamiensis]|uniref:Uncharacterized protein n=1 Tax=Micromonospora sagamiensis TaxID=47875 RepID=A0A562WPS8_9ACTN|nr:hypothetical protein [Micromonospora sagamiensis]TWJ32333.1 hypothetical protein JD81_05908 [Micromonospora sagamiensis]
MKRQDTMAILKHLVLIGLAVGAIFLAVAAGAGLLNRTPLRRPVRRERQG